MLLLQHERITDEYVSDVNDIRSLRVINVLNPLVVLRFIILSNQQYLTNGLVA